MKKQIALLLVVITVCVSFSFSAYASNEFELPPISITSTTKKSVVPTVDDKYNTPGVGFTTSTTKKTTTTQKSTTKQSTTKQSTTKSTTTAAPKNSIQRSSISNIKARTYNGNPQKQSPVVKMGKKTLKLGKDYKLTYKSNKNIGKAIVTVTGIGAYSGSKNIVFKIVPKGTALTKLTSKKGQLTAYWKKQASNTTGYQIQIATDKSFKKNVKVFTVSNNKTTSKAIKGLKSKKTYYVRVRSYKTVKSIKYYSSYSTYKAIKVK